MIQKNWDSSMSSDVGNFLREWIPPGVRLYDQQDNNGDAHVKAGLVGTPGLIPLADGKLRLSRWQGVFFCEFDGPRRDRRVIVTVMGDVS